MRVFISSTSEDLKAYRSVVEQVILDAGWAPVGMEHFSADPRGIVKRCQDEVSGCDLMILIQAFRRGWVPEPEQGGDGITSATAWEVRAADQRDPKIPVLVFLADDSWPRGLSDLDPQAVEWIDSFRGGLNRSAKFFKYEDGALPQFRALVREQLAIYRAPIAESREDASGVAATKRASRRRVVHPERSGQFANQPEDTGKGQPTRIAVAILWLFFAVCQLPALFGAQPFGYAEVFMLTALPTAIVTTWRLSKAWAVPWSGIFAALIVGWLIAFWVPATYIEDQRQEREMKLRQPTLESDDVSDYQGLDRLALGGLVLCAAIAVAARVSTHSTQTAMIIGVSWVPIVFLLTVLWLMQAGGLMPSLLLFPLLPTIQVGLVAAGWLSSRRNVQLTALVTPVLIAIATIWFLIELD